MILYLIHSTLSLILFLLVYHLMLERERVHQFNRYYLILSLIFSLTVSLIPAGLNGGLVGWFSLVPLTEEVSAVQGSFQTVSADSSELVQTENRTLVSPLYLVAALYGAVTLWLLANLLIRIKLLLMKVKRHPRIVDEGADIILLKEPTIPFSFHHYIFVNDDQYRSGEIDRMVLLHEKAHVREHHTADILLVELMRIVFWFNPFIYLYKSAIRLNHEYLADQAVVAESERIRDYQNLLFETVNTPTSGYPISRFNESMIRKRLIMMNRSSSGKIVLLKKMLIVPLVVISLALFGCEPTSSDTNPETLLKRTVKLEIQKSGHVKLDGEQYHLYQLESILGDLTNSATLLLDVEVQPETTFGVVNDVQQILRDNHAYRINYSVQEES